MNLWTLACMSILVIYNTIVIPTDYPCPSQSSSPFSFSQNCLNIAQKSIIPSIFIICLGYLSSFYSKNYFSKPEKPSLEASADDWHEYIKKLFRSTTASSHAQHSIAYFEGYFSHGFCTMIGNLDCPDHLFDELYHCLNNYTLTAYPPSQALSFYTTLSDDDKEKFINGIRTALAIREKRIETKVLLTSKPVYTSSFYVPKHLLHKRRKNLYNYTNNLPDYAHKSYTVSPVSKQLIAKNKFLLPLYQSLNGCCIHHALHKETLSILDTIAHTRRSASFNEIIMNFVDIGNIYNQFGFITGTLNALDVCWSFIACSSCAILEGAIQGLTKTITSQPNPFAQTSCLKESIATAADCLIQYLYGNPLLISLLDEIIKENLPLKPAIKKIINRLKKYIKQHPYNALQTLSAHTVQTFLAYKAHYALYLFMLSAYKKIDIYAKKINQNPQQPLTINELPAAIATNLYNKLLSSTTRDNLEILNNYCIDSRDTSTTITCSSSQDYEHLLCLDYELPLLKKAFDHSRKGIGKFSHTSITCCYEGILGIEYNRNTPNVNGENLSHDFMGLLEKKGFFNTGEKTYGINGIYKTDLIIDQTAYKDKTFFPQEWSRFYVLSKIFEAYDTFIAKQPTDLIKNENGYYVINSATNEGITLVLQINKEGTIVNASPVFKKI